MAAKQKTFSGATKIFEARSKKPAKQSKGTAKKKSQAWRSYTGSGSSDIPF